MIDVHFEINIIIIRRTAKVYVCISKLFEHIKCKSCSDIILKKQISAIITSLGETLAYLGIKANKNAKSHKKTVN